MAVSKNGLKEVALAEVQEVDLSPFSLFLLLQKLHRLLGNCRQITQRLKLEMTGGAQEGSKEAV